MRIAAIAVITITVLLGISAGLWAGESASGTAETALAAGISGQTCVGILGDPFFSVGIGSFAYLQDGFPLAEFGYQLSVIRDSVLRTSVRFGGFQFRTIHPLGVRAGWTLGARLHQLPYESGFYIRSRWTLGFEAGFMAELFPEVWARVSGVVLLDQPLLTGYGYFGSGAVGIEVSVVYFVTLGL